MRLFVALCLAWFTALTTVLPNTGAEGQPHSAPSSLGALKAREASPILRAVGPQIVPQVESQSPAPLVSMAGAHRSTGHASTPPASAWTQIVPASLQSSSAQRTVAHPHRVAALGAVAPHFATAPPLQS